MVPLSFSGEKHVAILLELELNARALSEQRQAGTSVPALLLHAVQLLDLQSKQAGAGWYQLPAALHRWHQ